MGRPAKFDRDALLDHAVAIAARVGPAKLTLSALAARARAPTGSIYHRFASMELVIAEAWIRALERFQPGFLEALDGSDTLEAGVRAARHTPIWARAHLPEARLLLLHRREELVARFPRELGPRAARLDASARSAIRAFARRHFGRSDRGTILTTVFALVDVPYGAVRRHLVAGHAPPVRVDDLVADACRSALSKSGRTAKTPRAPGGGG